MGRLTGASTLDSQVGKTVILPCVYLKISCVYLCQYTMPIFPIKNNLAGSTLGYFQITCKSIQIKAGS